MEIPNSSDHKIRFIVVGTINKLSKLIDILLQPFLYKIKRYTRDDNFFLNSMLQKTDPNTLMVTFDDKNLYSNIPHEYGKQAISFWIWKYTETLHPRFNKKFITDGIELILNDNSFQFDNKNYISILGTDKGTKMTPRYAILILAYSEENLYEITRKKYIRS